MLTGVSDHLFQHLGICLVKNKRTVATPEEPGRSGTGMSLFSPMTFDLTNAAVGIRLTWAKLLNPHTHHSQGLAMDYLNAIRPGDLCRFVNSPTGGHIWSRESAEHLCASLLFQVRKHPPVNIVNERYRLTDNLTPEMMSFVNHMPVTGLVMLPNTLSERRRAFFFIAPSVGIRVLYVTNQSADTVADAY